MLSLDELELGEAKDRYMTKTRTRQSLSEKLSSRHYFRKWGHFGATKNVGQHLKYVEIC